MKCSELRIKVLTKYMLEGFFKQLNCSAESDGVKVQNDKLRSETSTYSNESETSI